MRRAVLAVLAPVLFVLIGRDVGAADAPRPQVMLTATLQGGTLTRVQVAGTAARTLESRSTDGLRTEIDLTDASGSRIGVLRSQRTRLVRRLPSELRFVDASGIGLPTELVAVEPSADDPTTAASTLNWSDAEGTRWTLAAFGEARIELATATAAEPAVVPGPAPVVAPRYSFGLSAGSPNPFRRATTLRFSLSEPGRVSLGVYDVAGRRMARLLDETRAAGMHSIEYHGGALPRGHYFVRLQYVSTDGSITRTATTPIVRVD